eukprot:m.54228 g.54228  ORF g.54228 m.54228 type:complete len:730 (+) comp10912_c0_seq3:1986-4175(+)
MDFGSPFVYIGPSIKGTQGQPGQASQQNADVRNFLAVSAGDHGRRVDTNVIRVKMGCLTQDALRMDLPPLSCSKCGAVPSCTSDLDTYGEWLCEFCGQQSGRLNMEQFAKVSNPEVTSVDYPAGAAGTSGLSMATDTLGRAGPLLVFCIDTSGSMGVANEVIYGNGPWSCSACTFSNKPSVNNCEMCSTPNNPTDADGNGTKYVSRLDAVKAAVQKQMDVLCQQHPRRRVALVTFSDGVLVVGDGSQTPTVVSGDILFDKDMLLKAGIDCVKMASKPILQTKNHLCARMDEVYANGQTALGPAMLLSIAMAGTQAGSQVVVCTDGLSNVGLGELSTNPSPLEMQYAEALYNSAGEYAMNHGVTVSVISIKGEECNLRMLGILADLTGGSVTRVDLEQLSASVSEISAMRANAYGVNVKLILHANLYPMEEGLPVSSPQGFNGHSQILGAVNESRDVLFQFGPASKEILAERQRKHGKWPFRVPFQVQITYVPPGTTEARMRVLSADLPVTDSPEQALDSLDQALLGLFGERATAKLAREGNPVASRQLAAAYRDLLLLRNKKPGMESVYEAYISNVAQINRHLDDFEGQNIPKDELVAQAYQARGTATYGTLSRQNPLYDIAADGHHVDDPRYSGYKDVRPNPDPTYSFLDVEPNPSKPTTVYDIARNDNGAVYDLPGGDELYDNAVGYCEVEPAQEYVAPTGIGYEHRLYDQTGTMMGAPPPALPPRT